MITITPLQPSDIEEMVASFLQLGWTRKGFSQFEQYFREHKGGARTALVARAGGTFAGYVTLLWRSAYPAFAEKDIPEISDLNVLPHYRCRGIGSQLMDTAERLVATRSPVVGIGVGLHEDYGAAQRLYVQRGYVPNGRGITARGSQVLFGDRIVADDDLVLWFTKAF